jgi:hypothetical protein
MGTHPIAFSTTPSSNSTIDGTTVSGSTPSSSVDDWVRSLMAATRESYPAPVTKTSDYTAVQADCDTLLVFTNSATLTLPNYATAGDGWCITVAARAAVTLATASGTITFQPADAATSNTIPAGTSARIIANGAGYTVSSGIGGVTATGTALIQSADAAAARSTLGLTWVPVTTLTPSASSLVTLNSLGDYRHIRLIGSLTPSAACAIGLQVSLDNGANYIASNYATHFTGVASSAYATATSNNSATYLFCSPSAAASTVLHFEQTLWDFGIAAPTASRALATGVNVTPVEARYEATGRQYGSASIMDAFVIFPTAGNLTGHITVEGILK